MSGTRRLRLPSAEERQLWAQVARGVTPLKGRTWPAAEPTDPEVLDQQPSPASEPAERRAIRPEGRLPPLAPLERRTAAALRRGTRDVEGIIDLHGLRQSEAHAALLSYLRRSQRAGRRLVLVITGKGAAAAGDAWFEERGVLRRMVPHWLRLPDARPLVLGFESAARQHGGAGAFYVRLRRPRPSVLGDPFAGPSGGR